MPDAKETEEPPSRPPTISSSASQPGVPSSREYARRSPSTKVRRRVWRHTERRTRSPVPSCRDQPRFDRTLDHLLCALSSLSLSLLQFNGCPLPSLVCKQLRALSSCRITAYSLLGG